MIPTKKSWYIFFLFVNVFFQTTRSFTIVQKKILSSLSYWSILAIPYGRDIRGYTKNNYRSYALAEPAVDVFVRTILQQYACPESMWQSVRIVHGRRFACDSIWHTIEVPISEKYLKAVVHAAHCTVQDCTKCASYNGYITKDTLSRCIGAILHEAGHLMHNDLQVWVGATVVTPPVVNHIVEIFSDYLACKKMGAEVSKYTLPWQRAIYKLCSTILISDIVLMGVKKYREQCADTFAIDHIHDPAVLHAISKDFFEDHRYIRKNLSPWKRKLYDRFSLLYELTTKNHPSNVSRAQCFKKAALKLSTVHE